MSVFMKIFTYSPNDVFLILQILWTIIIIKSLNPLCSLPGLIRILTSKKVVPRELPPGFVDRLIYFTKALLNKRILFLQPNCMIQSLVLYKILKKNNFAIQLFFGIRKEHEKLDGHCWLELDGDIILENDDPNKFYKVVTTYS